MKFNENISSIHAYLCADGYVCTNLPHQKHKYYSIGLRNINLNLLKDFQAKFNKEFKIKPKLIIGERCRLYSKEIYKKLMENGPYHSNNWTYPKISKENSKHWLRSFFDCEGWIINNKRKTRSICAESINQNGLYDIQKALERLNIRSTIYDRQNRDIYSLMILDKKSIIKFEKEINFFHPLKKERLRKAIESFVNYKWNISSYNIRKIMKQKSRLKKPNVIRIFSIIKSNLEKLSYLLNKEYDVESKIYKSVNGNRRVYYYLAIQKKSEIKKLISHNLLDDETIGKLAKIL
jgi:hypothetical protein